MFSSSIDEAAAVMSLLLLTRFLLRFRGENGGDLVESNGSLYFDFGIDSKRPLGVLSALVLICIRGLRVNACSIFMSYSTAGSYTN